MKSLVLGYALAVAGLGLAEVAAGAENVRPKAMEALPLGTIRPEGWLRLQLEKQRDGLTGHAEELYGDIGKSDWLTGQHKGGEHCWERGPHGRRAGGAALDLRAHGQGRAH